MLIHTMLAVQMLFTNVAVPSEKEIMNDTQLIMESAEQGEEDLTQMMQRYAAYNLWANQQFTEWLGSASEEQMNQEIVSSYSNLKETIRHIWSAEYLWLQVLKDESYGNSPAKSFDGNKEELLDGWIKASENFSNHVKSMSVADLQNKRPKSSGDGQNMVYMDIIQHCMNHSTYHRGQLITMGRQVGLTDPPRTDYIYYVGIAD